MPNKTQQQYLQWFSQIIMNELRLCDDRTQKIYVFLSLMEKQQNAFSTYIIIKSDLNSIHCIQVIAFTSNVM